MKLNVFVHGRVAAVLESTDGFDHHLTYLSTAQPDDFISLTMPVQTHSWNWPALHPFFHVSLPEGFLLSVLKEQLGPHLGASPLHLLSVVGHNLIGRVQVSAGTEPAALQAAADLRGLLHGLSSQSVFLELMAQYAVSGVSGVVPKFLTPATAAMFRKGTLTTERHIVKGSSEHQPFVALNEHLCMLAAHATGFDAAQTQVSEDGQVLVVDRFDISAHSGQRLGFEDFCSLLGLTPEEKYESTWERVARLTRDYVPGAGLRSAHEQLAVTLLLTFALGNADCHTKNLAFIYSGFDDVRVAPIYDMLYILAYDRYADNPPGMYVDGRKRWDGMKAIWRYLQQFLGLEPARQRELVDTVCTAVSGTVPELLHHMHHTPGFADVGRRMLWQWNEGMKRLSERRSFTIPDFSEISGEQGLPPPLAPQKHAALRLGESPLLAPRKRARPSRLS